MEAQKKLESKMDEVFVKNAPLQVPESGRKAIVKYIPYISLIGGVLSLIAAWNLWQLGHRVNDYVQTLDNYARSYGVDTGYTGTKLGPLFYIALAVLVLQAALMLFAYPGLKARSKSRGWNIILYSSLASLVYGLFVTFTDQGTVFNFVGAIIGAVIGLFLLAQIKSYYNGAGTARLTRK